MTTGKQVDKLSYPAGGMRFDWWVTILSSYFVYGVYQDVWAHFHLDSTLETFFTPWHAMLYSGYAFLVIFLSSNFILNLRKGYKAINAIPRGYQLSLVGLVLFGMSGLGDMLWHITLGIEKGVEALLSPTHLLLIIGMALIVSGPFRASWHRRDVTSNALSLIPVIISMTLTFSVITLITEYSNPLLVRWPLPYTIDTINLWTSATISGILVQSIIMVGLVFTALRRWKLPFGSLTFILGINAIGMTLIGDTKRYVPAIFLAGLVSDILLSILKPSSTNSIKMHLFAFMFPAVYYLFYFGVPLYLDRVNWSVPLWSGSIVAAGIAGLLISYLSLSPGIKDTE